MHGALETLLRPGSVAVVGATEDIRTFAGAPLHNLVAHGYAGAVYPVNPGRERVQGVRCYPSVLDIPGAVDTAVIAVPSRAVLGVLRDCVAREVRSATIVSSGFGEDAAGPEGKVRAAELRELIRSSGIRVLGPNTTGLLNLNDSYVPRAAYNQLGPGEVRPGAIALITQSGACGNIVFNRAQANGVGVGLSVATGDQIDVDLWDLCELAIADERLRMLMVVAETLGDTRRFERAALRAAATGKPVALLKLGRSEMGQRAVLTHSGSLAGDAAVQSAAMRQLGVVEVDDLDDLWQLARLVERWGPPGAREERLGVFSLSGGEAALIADRCAEHGIDLPPPTGEFSELIERNFAYAMAANPYDPSGEITSRPEKMRLAIRGFLERNDYTHVLFAAPVLRAEQAERQLGELHASLDEPRPRMCFSFWPAGELTRTLERILTETGEPVFAGSGAAVRAIAHYRRAGRRRRDTRPAPVAQTPPPGALAPGARYWDVRAALTAAGLPFAAASLARTAAEARAAAERHGPPVALKANVTSSVHKMASGLIALHLRTPDDVATAFERLTAAGRAFAADGVVVEAMAGGQLEVLVGAHRDPDFGPALLFGSGGTAVEYLRDTALGLAAYTDRAEALAMVRATRAGALLGDRAPAAVEALAGLLTEAAAWFAANPQVAALDLNPLLVDLGTGAIACVDARVA
jgi:acyl-CoA synthetase (NDP forming)